MHLATNVPSWGSEARRDGRAAAAGSWLGLGLGQGQG